MYKSNNSPTSTHNATVQITKQKTDEQQTANKHRKLPTKTNCVFFFYFLLHTSGYFDSVQFPSSRLPKKKLQEKILSSYTRQPLNVTHADGIQAREL